MARSIILSSGYFSTLVVTSCLAMLLPAMGQAQTITPAMDGTGTQVAPVGNTFEIRGGTQTGANLFHSFQQFGLTAEQTASFLANPSIQNILGRVTGGEASYINGLIRVTGGNSNLYLMNPSGILFGPNASLSVPASFTATTANGIGFGNGWFHGIGTNDYATLLGNPTSFGFTSLESGAFGATVPGAIANFGNLTVNAGQSLTLLGGTVLNRGTLTAPGGQVTIAAVPGETLVRISQQNSLLSLELSPLAAPFSSPSVLHAPLSLPSLLTGGTLNSATGVSINADGTLQLTGSTPAMPTTAGTAIVSGTVDTASTLQNGGVVQVFGKQVALLGATIDVSGRNGGTVLIGGDYQGQGTVPTATFTYSDRATTIRADGISPNTPANGGRVIVWADDTTRFFGSISANGGIAGGNGGFIETSGRNALQVTGASISAAAPQGQAGTWLLDPRNITIRNEISAGGFLDTLTGAFTPFADDAVVATSDIEAALNDGINVTIFTGFDGVQAGNIVLASPLVVSASGSPTLTLRAANDIVLDAPIFATSDGPLNLSFSAQRNVAINARINTEGGDFNSSSQNFSSADAIITTASLGSNAGDIFINAPAGINTRALIASQTESFSGGPGGRVTLFATEGSILVGAIDTRASNVGQGGDVQIEAGRSFRAVDRFLDSSTNTLVSISTTGPNGGGAVEIKYGGSAPFVIGNASNNGTAGAIATAPTNQLLPPKTITGQFVQGNITIQSDGNNDFADSQDDLATDLTETDDSGDGFADLAFDDGQETDATDTDVDTDEEDYTDEFEDYLELPEDATAQPVEVGSTLRNIAAQTGVKPALVYVTFVPTNVATGRSDRPIAQAKLRSERATVKANRLSLKTGSAPNHLSSEVIWQFNGLPNLVPPSLAQATSTSRATNDSDQLELVIVTAEGQPLRRLIAGATRQRVQETVRQFLNEVSDPRKTRTRSYLPYAQQLYRWLVAPIEPLLTTRGIGNIAYIADTGLRFIPFVALHDGQQFLIEKFSVGLMPSLSLTDTRYVNLNNAQVLAMGASEFADQPTLPAVPTELSVITSLWQGEALLNQNFTLQALKTERQQEPYQIIHLATHGEFQSGNLSNSYIQFWDTKLRLNELRQLGLNNPPVELLVLSACRTALGSDDAELGFAGFAVQAGVKSALASLWSVSDEGTLGFMSEFYRQLKTAPIKAEALRQAQIAMLKGQVKIEGSQLRNSRGGEVNLPATLTVGGPRSLSHPYFWSAFTLIGSPW